MSFDVVKPFDPWKSKLCTCKDKFSFNPYTGCIHGCLYCYATYIPNFRKLRLKKDLLKRLEKDLEKLNNVLISMSNSSDPYPPVEREYELTRKCLLVMKEYDMKLLVVTKSDLVVRDLDLLSEMRCAVSITVTAKEKSSMEPNAPPPQKRIDALERLKDAGIPVILRFDPVIPFVNDGVIDDVIESCSFVDHVVTSTLKLRHDSFRRIIKVFPELGNKYKKLYFEEGDRIQNSWYLPAEMRKSILEKVAEKCKEFGISCAFCREGFEFNAKSCDGSHLIRD